MLQRVEAQATRMTALVEDLLLLARLDAGRPLEHALVDLTALVVESVGDAHVAGPRHHWRLELPDDLVMVAGDNVRLHQVVANLLANARTHAPSSTVAVGLSTTDHDVRLTATDDARASREPAAAHLPALRAATTHARASPAAPDSVCPSWTP